jgi:pyrroloquinoline quinone biosynthesis protein B
MRVVVLGSAAGGGFPQWNCACEPCRVARDQPARAKPRTQASVAIEDGEGEWFLLNASPDLRQQVLTREDFRPRRGPRDSPIAGVILTNADVDHVAGLLSLRERQRFTIYATERVLSVLASNGIFGVLDPAFVARQALALDAATRLHRTDGQESDLVVTAFGVPGKVALYLEDAAAGPDFGTVEGDTVGLHVSDRTRGGAFHYVPACAALTEPLAHRLEGSSLLFFDGTTWSDDEMLTAQVGTKTGRRMGHMAMAGPEGSIARLAALPIGRKVFIHINNTNPVLIEDSPERRTARAAGWAIAEDGMEFAL